MRGAVDRPISEAQAGALFYGLDLCPALALAVSGGPDSTALMWLAARWRDALENPPKLIALTVDHGLRPESAREALAVKQLAAKFKVEHRTLRWTGGKPRTGIQQAAREARYRLLGKAARRAGAGHLLTAHTLDDQAETMLLRIAAGTGVSGLAAMYIADSVPVPEGWGVLLVRPLLRVPRARLIATLEDAKIGYATDPSNSDPRFARSRLRTLMPALAREGLTPERFAKLSQRVQRIEQALFEIGLQVRRELSPGDWPEGGPISADAEAFLDLPAEIGLRLLGAMVGRVATEGRPELGQLERLHDDLTYPGISWLQMSSGRVRRTLAGALITLTAAKLTVERAPPRRIGAKSGAKARSNRRKGAFTKLR